MDRSSPAVGPSYRALNSTPEHYRDKIVVPTEVRIIHVWKAYFSYTKAKPQRWYDTCIVTKYVPVCSQTPRQDLVYRYPRSSLQPEVPIEVPYEVPLIYLHDKQRFLSTSLKHRTHLFSVPEGHITRRIDHTPSSPRRFASYAGLPLGREIETDNSENVKIDTTHAPVQLTMFKKPSFPFSLSHPNLCSGYHL